MQIAKIVTIVKIPFATAETGKNKMTGKHALIPRNDFPNDKIAYRPGIQGPGPPDGHWIHDSTHLALS